MSARSRSTKSQFGRLFAVLLLLPVTVSCIFGGGENVPKLFPDALEVLQQGKEQLEAGEYLKARNTLEPLLDETKDIGVALNHNLVAKDQARYSYVMANSLNQINEWINTTSLILGIAVDAGLFGAPGVDDGFNPAALSTLGGSGLVAGALDSMLDSFSDFFSKNSKILQEIKKNPDFSINYLHLPLKFDAVGITVMDLLGEHDLGEVYFLDAVYLLADAVMKTILAVDFTISFKATDLPLGYIGDRVQAEFDSENPAYMDLLSNLTALILHKQRKLLGLASGPVMTEAGTLYAASFASLGSAIDTILAETDDQSDDLVARLEKDDEIYLKLNIDFGNIVVIDLETLENLEFLVTDELQAALDNIQAAFAGEAGKRVSWARDIVPVLSVIAAALVRSGFVEVLLDAALDLSGSDPAAVGDISGLLNSDLIN